MQRHFASFKNFIFTQYFSDGIKITIGVLLPSLIFFQYDNLLVGLPISLGALCVSIADNPGPLLHKRNAMILTVLFIGINTIITGLLSANPYFLGIEILLLSFFFSMFHIYGDRAAGVGTAALLIMILNIDHVRPFEEVLIYGFYVVAGGIWYMLLSFLFVQIMPYRYAEQTLGECTKEIAKYLHTRAHFYGDKIDVNDNFKHLVDQQVIVNHQLENVREILFKTKKIQRDTTANSRKLIMIFIDIVDIFEQTTITHYDYNEIRKQFEQTHILSAFEKIINQLASEINYLGICLINHEKPGRHMLTIHDLDALKSKLDDLENVMPTLVLKKVLINIRNIFIRVDGIYNYFIKKDTIASYQLNSDAEFERFVSHQTFNLKLLLQNLTLKSSFFRHALRVAMVSLFGYLIAKLLPVGHHSYWILLTIMVILKPGFSLTKQRNYERVIGTIVGGLVGSLILLFIKNQTVLFSFLLLFMVLTYSFQRIKYIVSVLFMTPFILILFTFITSENDINLVGERVIDTLIGSAIAFIASYLILPNWESYNFKTTLAEMVKANLDYFVIILTKLSGKPVSLTEYKLIRKEVYVSTANLGGALQRMINEPKNKQLKTNDVHKFVVLNHTLTSYLANLSITSKKIPFTFSTDQIKSIQKSYNYLKESWLVLCKDQNIVQQQIPNKPILVESSLEENHQANFEQLELILKVSSNIFKVSEKL